MIFSTAVSQTALRGDDGADQVHQHICVQQDHGHQSYSESRRVASKGMGGLDGRLAIHSRSRAIFTAAASRSLAVDTPAGSRRRRTSSPHDSTVNRVRGGAKPGGTTNAPVSSAWIVWPIYPPFYRREARRGMGRCPKTRTLPGM